LYEALPVKFSWLSFELIAAIATRRIDGHEGVEVEICDGLQRRCCWRGIEQPGIEADATQVVQLLPYDAGLKLTPLVRPFGAGGPAYVAGLGGRSVL
jgi:hypothetical protein